MSDRQAATRIYAYILRNLDYPINAATLAKEADCNQGIASKYLREFNLPGYTCTRIGHSFVISRNGHSPRPAKPKPAAQPEPRRSSCLNCREPIVQNGHGVWIHQQGRARGCLFLATPVPSEAEQ